MGTRADFYVGKEWLGSLAFDGHRVHEMQEQPDTTDDDCRYCWQIKTATSEGDFRSAVAGLLHINDDATTPDQGWPWPWDDSRTTDRAYVFDGAVTKCYAWGKEIIGDGDDDAEGPETSDGWPDMTGNQNVVVGTQRDGVILVGSK